MMGATSFVKVTWRAPALAGACAEIACVSKIAAASANKVTKRKFTRLIGLPSSHSSSKWVSDIPNHHVKGSLAGRRLPDEY